MLCGTSTGLAKRLETKKLCEGSQELNNSAPNLDLLGCRYMKHVRADAGPHEQSVLSEIVASEIHEATLLSSG